MSAGLVAAGLLGLVTGVLLTLLAGALLVAATLHDGPPWEEQDGAP